MQIAKYNIPSVMLDNDMQMFSILFKVIEKVDNEAKVQIHSTLKSYKVIIEVSDQNLKDELLQEVKELSFILGDVFEFSKSIKYSQYITFFTK